MRDQHEAKIAQYVRAIERAVRCEEVADFEGRDIAFEEADWIVGWFDPSWAVLPWENWVQNIALRKKAG